MRTARLAGTLSSVPSSSGDELRRAAPHVDLLEVRGDRIGDIDPDWLRSRVRGRLLFTLRSAAEGGAFDAAPAERHRRLAHAAGRYDLVDLEADRDLVPELLERIPPERRLISWAGAASDAASLRRRVERLTAVVARFYKVVPEAAANGDGLAPLEVLQTCKRSDLMAFAGGAAGFWSRLLSPYAGAPFVFGTIGTSVRSLEEPPITQLIEDYGYPQARRPDALYAIVGNPVTHSLSAQLHNAAYRALGLSALFVPFEEADFAEFWRTFVERDPLGRYGFSIKGLTVVSPHKELALGTEATMSSAVVRAGAANIVVKNGRGWRADTTDPEGVVEALRERGMAMGGRRTAVIGCGGAGRAVASALVLLGADVTLVNRSLDRGCRAARQLRLPFIPLAKFSARGYATVVNATPLGRDGEALPFEIAAMRQDGAVVDLTYGRDETPLIREARTLGLTFVDGREVCLIQVRHQFRRMTGFDMPLPASTERELPAAACSTSGA